MCVCVCVVGVVCVGLFVWGGGGNCIMYLGVEDDKYGHLADCVSVLFLRMRPCMQLYIEAYNNIPSKCFENKPEARAGPRSILEWWWHPNIVRLCKYALLVCQEQPQGNQHD